jgi:hypothetical protein
VADELTSFRCSADRNLAMLYLRQSMAVSLLVCICGLLPAVAQENNDPYDERNALAISQAAVGRVVGNHRFSKRSGIPVSM